MCHMLAPKAYERDCRAIAGDTVDHRVLGPQEFQRTRERTSCYWTERYTEPFYVDYTKCWDTKLTTGYQSKLSYAVLAAAARQSMFINHVSLPHYTDRKFLDNALRRYKQFLFLRNREPEEFLVPCYDIDLMWHAHQLNPLIYKSDTVRITGSLFNHDDSVNERHEGSKLNIASEKTQTLWKKYFYDSLSLFGAMYREKPPRDRLYTLTQRDELEIRTKQCAVSLDRVTLTLSDMSKRKQLSLSVAGARAYGSYGKQWCTIKGKDFPRPRESAVVLEKIGCFMLDTHHEAGVIFTVFQKSGLLRAKKLLCSAFLDLSSQVESAYLAQSTCLLQQQFQLPDGSKLSIDGHVIPKRAGDISLSLNVRAYNYTKVTDDAQALFRPIAIETLPTGVDNSCRVATHSLSNLVGKEAFKVRIIHSASMVMSAIQIFYKDKLSAIAHLIGADQLPLPTQVIQESVTLNPKEGKRAVLIKNNDGDWAVVTGKWVGRKKGLPGTRSRRGIPGSPGTLRIKFYKTSTND